MTMLANRSMPTATVIPELAYPDVGQAATWLCEAFGFEIRLRIANHRIQLTFGDGAIVLTTQPGDRTAAVGGSASCSMMIRVENVDEHSRHARSKGAIILREAETQVYGERQYTAVDPAGRLWTFSQSIADVDPKEWGGVIGRT